MLFLSSASTDTGSKRYCIGTQCNKGCVLRVNGIMFPSPSNKDSYAMISHEYPHIDAGISNKQCNETQDG